MHIGFFGLRNAGKSSVVNAVTGQKLSLVSDIAGTTTDPVQKAMELLPLGPVVIIDTPGFDDEGILGEMRVQRAMNALNKTDIAVLVTDAENGLCRKERELIALFDKKSIPHIIAYNKADLLRRIPACADDEIFVSALKNTNITELKERMAKVITNSQSDVCIVADLLSRGDMVVLVTPIDAAAPKGRLILPQQQTIREILDAGAVAVVTKETELSDTLNALAVKPRMVITDSQVFEFVNEIVPPSVPLTSFSVLLARRKGSLETSVKGVARLDNMRDNETVLISEGCTHHRQCDDIGTVKLPKWISDYTGKRLNYEFTSGGEFPDDLSKYALVVHCGGCMLNGREMKSRVRHCIDCEIPITNYGIAIAHIHGILKRSLSPFE